MLNLYQYKFITSFALLIISVAEVFFNFSISKDAKMVSSSFNSFSFPGFLNFSCSILIFSKSYMPSINFSKRIELMGPGYTW